MSECGKTKHASMYDANLALLYAWKAHSKGDEERRIRSSYYCERCDAWHVSSRHDWKD